MVSSVPAYAWAFTLALLTLVVVVDLRVIARRGGEVGMAQSVRWVTFYVALAVAFGVVVALTVGGRTGAEFFSGYITEYSLSVDNLFVFVIIMTKFAVPRAAQDKVLYLGIVLSMLLRAVFIFAGAALIAAASWTFYLFGLLLIYTAVTLLREDDDPDFEEYRLLRVLRRVLPMTPHYHGDRLAVHHEGRRHWTPLVIAISAIGLANVVFALDSIPAIFGLTQDAFVIVAANAFALMGLRQLYFLVGGLLERLIYLNIGLSAILAFIGAKLIIEALHGSHIDHLGSIPLPQIGILTSLGFIVVVLVTAALASLAKNWLDQRSTSA
ncbi:TerC/Alx family metal homeostasis membrane protein [Phycicoccus sp. M110.8]|uniref:TerC/Alx family metal homeostasis membrane protein n=1 Tax=Phycicoccus sp. M110.8 TaxID=3075433 RepID=UPI0028FD6909|nr:TerC/Alx family metal homeostasis membrane protein [Phycicoccus sp. M110.8]MDU0313071.1 TerC/Alx family metal homeostasis membrane protein [Phycicoccus sp. M110.8]